MRRSLNLLALAVTSMMAIAFVIPLLGLVASIASDRAEAAAERDVQLIAQIVTAADSRAVAARAFSTIAPGGVLNGRAITLAYADGAMYGAPLPSATDLATAFAGGATNTAETNGRAITVPAIGPDGAIAAIRISITDAELTRGVARSRLMLIGLSVVLVAIAVWVTDRLAQNIVRPVRELSAASEQLGSGNLSARVEPSGPKELHEVGQQFNRLAGDVAALLQGERETAADLSHRLRTPLTAARLDAERLSDPEERAKIMADLDDIERNVDHAIGVMRAPGQSAASRTVLEQAVRDRAAFWEPLAAEQQRALSIDIPSTQTRIAVRDDSLDAALDALIGNVFTHTAEGTGYGLVVAIEDVAAVTVEDAGPGIESSRATERGRSASGSTGLGLDIARRTAQLAGGDMRIERSDLGGAKVTLTFPKV